MNTTTQTPSCESLPEQLAYLKLPFMREQHAAQAQEAAQAHWDHLAYLARLAAGEAALRRERSVQRRITQARFLVIKTLEQFSGVGPSRSIVCRCKTCSACSSLPTSTM